MKSQKRSAAGQLTRLAKESAESKIQSRALPAGLPLNANEKLEALLRNVGRIVMVPLSDLSLSENVRKYVPTNTPEFQQLVDSVKKDGILQNLMADLKIETSGKYKLDVVSGQRRFIAGEIAGTQSCPVRIMQYTNRASRIAHGIAENVLRDNLHCLDLAEGYAELLKEGWTEEQIAETFDRKRQTVMQHLRLARYPEEAKSFIREHMDQFTSYDLLNKFVAHKWKDTQTLITALKEHFEGRAAVKARQKTDEVLQKAGKDLSLKSGYKINVTGTSESGQIAIKWVGEEQQKALFLLLNQMSDGEA
jgi:ParB/RepB/Spo0J family partition protein